MPSAITYAEFGGPEVLRVTEVELPAPEPGQVRVAVRATSVNPIDIKIRRGDMAGSGPASFPPRIPGLDVAGVVQEVGEGVVDRKVGEEVFGVASGGSYAQHALLSTMGSKPANVSWELAACLSTAGEAAYRALGHLNLGAGQTLLIHGAAGSVGGIATQLALARGVTVIGSAAERDLEYVGSLGAIPVRYGEGLPERVRALGRGGVDAALDTAGHGVLPDSIELTGSVERVITIADPSAQQLGVRFTGADPDDRAWEALPQLAELAAAGKLQLPIWRTYPLAQASTAHADVEAGNNHGKIVLLP